MTCFAITAGSGKLCHLEVERLGELRRYPVLVEHHLHGITESGQGLFARVAVSERGGLGEAAADQAREAASRALAPPPTSAANRSAVKSEPAS